MNDGRVIKKVYGPPGTGKTNMQARYIREAMGSLPPEKILITSFSKGGAAELIQRAIGKDETFSDYRYRMVAGTLHSICFKAFNKPAMIETAEGIKEWNSLYPEYELSATEISEDSGFQKKTIGDVIFADMMLNRAKMIPVEEWSDKTIRFYNKWIEWKGSRFDFTDLIERGLKELDIPNRAKSMFVDEAQDFTALEFALIEKWMKEVNFGLISGDDDQAIYNFKGCNPDNFLDFKETETEILAQSYRVPRVVHEHATKFITQVTRRQEKDYKPCDFDGEIIESKYTYKNGIQIAEQVSEYIQQGKKVMLLTMCGYMLENIRTNLKRQGITFFNPYRSTRYDWNPFEFSFREKGRMSLNKRLWFFLNLHDGKNKIEIPEIKDFDFLFDFQEEKEEIPVFEDLIQMAEEKEEKEESIVQRGIFNMEITSTKGYWTGKEFKSWALALKNLFIRGQVKEIEEISDIEKIDYIRCLSLFKEQEDVDKAFAGDTEWFLSNLKTEHHKNADFCRNIIKRNGLEGLIDEPGVIVGTIFSVKGAEADVVYLFPDLSPQGYKETYTSHRDSLIRLFYVGMTRAKETLILCNPVSYMFLNLKEG